MEYNRAMKKYPLSLAVVAVLALPLGAAHIESLKASGFALPPVSLEVLRGDSRAPVPGVAVTGASAPLRQQRWVGYVSLEGHDFASVGVNWIRLTVSGKMNVVDENGTIVLKNVPVAYAGLFEVSQRYIFGYAQIEAPVALRVDGRVAAEGVLRGAVKMQGFISAGLARIRGNGQVSGQVTLSSRQ